MRMPIDLLKVKALLVVEDAGRRVGLEPIGAEPGLRLALAFLYAVGDQDRALFDDYWRAVVDQPHGATPAARRAQQSVVPLVNRIYRTAGVDRSVAMMAAGTNYARRGKDSRV